MSKVEEKYIKRDTDVRPGDTVKVHLRITEAGKERVQIFEGIVIGVKGTGLGKTITVRKMSHGVGVEKILPVNSPMVKKIDVVKRGNVRRSKLYYMRRKIGKRSLDVTEDENFEGIIEDDEMMVPDETESIKEEMVEDKEELAEDKKQEKKEDKEVAKEEEKKPEEKEK